MAPRNVKNKINWVYCLLMLLQDNWIAHQDDFNELLAQLNNHHGQNKSSGMYIYYNCYRLVLFYTVSIIKIILTFF